MRAAGDEGIWNTALSADGRADLARELGQLRQRSATILAASFVMTGLLAALLAGASGSATAKGGLAILTTGPLLMSFFYAARAQRPFPPPTRDTVVLSDYRSQAITYRRQVFWLMAAAALAVIGLLVLTNPARTSSYSASHTAVAAAQSFY